MKINYQLPSSSSEEISSTDVKSDIRSDIKTDIRSDIKIEVVKKNDIYKYNHYNKYDKKPEKSDFKYDKHETKTVKRCLAKELDLINTRPQRAGVIMYTKYLDQVYFGIGVDTLSGEYTDFGGGISYKDKKDKNVVLGALREYEEETLGIFGNLTYEDVQDCTVIYNHQNLILFRYIEPDFKTIHHLFTTEYNKRVGAGEIPEVCNIKWVTTKEFKEIIATRGKVFHRVQCFLQQAGDFTRFF